VTEQNIALIVLIDQPGEQVDERPAPSPEPG
jgi:hypothetical protein